jgi:hypothetical protein
VSELDWIVLGGAAQTPVYREEIVMTVRNAAGRKGKGKEVDLASGREDSVISQRGEKRKREVTATPRTSQRAERETSTLRKQGTASQAGVASQATITLPEKGKQRQTPAQAPQPGVNVGQDRAQTPLTFTEEEQNDILEQEHNSSNAPASKAISKALAAKVSCRCPKIQS